MIKHLSYTLGRFNWLKRTMIEKTTFKILKMDCPSEENMIRVKLEDNPNVKSLKFDLESRELIVFHNQDKGNIENSIFELNLDASTIDTLMVESSEVSEDKIQSRLLWYVLFINFTFFIVEMTTGLLSKSMGLVADSLDMLADSFVYGISLFAVGGTILLKKRIAKIAGVFQITLAIIGFIEILRRFFLLEDIPDFLVMVIVSVFALIANVTCLFILQKSKSNEAHMKASMIFTSNDIIINMGVIIAGGLVYLFNSKYPDLIVGAIVFLLVIQGAIRILKLSR